MLKKIFKTLSILLYNIYLICFYFYYYYIYTLTFFPGNAYSFQLFHSNDKITNLLAFYNFTKVNFGCEIRFLSIGLMLLWVRWCLYLILFGCFGKWGILRICLIVSSLRHILHLCSDSLHIR